MDVQALLRQKDAELEQRAALLLKTKSAIEQLQEELGSARQEVDRWRKVAERQGGELADAQRQVYLLEAELEAKAREGSSLLADTLALKRQLQEAHDGLHSATDTHSSQQATLVARLRDAEHALSAFQVDDRAQKEQVAALQAAVADRERGLAEQAGSTAKLEQQRAQLEASNSRLQEQLTALQRQHHELAAAAEQEQARLAASTQQLEARLGAEAEGRQKAEQAAVAAREALADEQKGRALDEGAWERRLRELQQDAAERQQRSEAAWAAKSERQQQEAAAALEEARRQLTKRLYLAEGEWAKKLQQSSADWAAKLDMLGTEWLQRCETDKAAWAAERQRLQEELERQLVDADQAHASAVEDVKQQYRRKVAALEARAEAGAQATERAWQQRLEAAAAKAESERQTAADSWAAAAAQREQHLLSQLVAAQEASAAKLAELDKQWASKLAAAQEQALKERHELERCWADKLHAADKAASEAQASLRSQLEARLAAVSERVGSIVHRENKQERKQAALLRQVTELEAASEVERSMRRQAEAALHDASTIFKRELADKNQQLDLLRQEVRFLRTWTGNGAAVTAGCCLNSSLEGGSMLGLPAAAASVAPLMSPHRSASPCAASRCCSPAFRSNQACSGGPVHHGQWYSAPVSPAGDKLHPGGGAAASAAARAVEAEVRALRSARRAYQRAVLGQQEVCTSMARTIHEALKHEGAAGSPLARPQSAGTGIGAGGGIAAAGRRKWKRDLAAELQSLQSVAGGAAAGEVD